MCCSRYNEDVPSRWHTVTAVRLEGGRRAAPPTTVGANVPSITAALSVAVFVDVNRSVDFFYNSQDNQPVGSTCMHIAPTQK